ncbi:M13 family metallopeptidase [Enterocloster sp.]|uniref:M13 family metallopeptidase n=1 Tax=Enterocloster sp. TaxID=2719315 RepID=UPI00283D3703|nr:M13 family metallopeptidase [Enterocloster sp.]MDR3755809.1 M13 family metallopeptidase [Enterocloster sp.]
MMKKNAKLWLAVVVGAAVLALSACRAKSPAPPSAQSSGAGSFAAGEGRENSGSPTVGPEAPDRLSIAGPAAQDRPSSAAPANPPSAAPAAEGQAAKSRLRPRLEDDYYEYVNWDILSKTRIPGDSSSWSYLYQLNQDAYARLDQLLKETVKKRPSLEMGSTEQKIADFYRTALDEDARAAAGFGGLAPYLESVRSAATISQYLESLSGLRRDLGLTSLINVQKTEDLRDSSRYVYCFFQPDLGPGKETLEDGTMGSFLDEYQGYIGRVMEYSGMEPGDAKKAASEILAFQRELAAATLPLSRRQDPDVYYNPYTAAQLQQLLSNVDVPAYLNALGIAGRDFYVVTDVKALEACNDWLTEDHLELLKNYTVFCLLSDMSLYLTPQMQGNALAWHNFQNGIAEMKAADKLAGEMTQSMFGFEFGRLYAEQCFSGQDKENVTAMIRQILAAYKKRILALDWMGDETKANAVKKLDSMTLKVGYPDHFTDVHATARITPPEQGGTLIGNVLALMRAETAFDLEEGKKPVDKEKWAMTPQTVNAYYNPSGNEIVFPAGILQEPFYSPEADLATDMGGIGMVIAHEISHAFDSSGAMYDEKGNYKMWWTEEDLENFRALAGKVADYYDGQEGFEGRFVNGEQTLGENIADLGSLSCVTSIVGDDTDGLRALFTRFATIWASKYTDEAMIRRLNTDVHSPAKVRVNAVLRNTDAFYLAYPQLREGDKMYLAPEQRVGIW